MPSRLANEIAETLALPDQHPDVTAAKAAEVDLILGTQPTPEQRSKAEAIERALRRFGHKLEERLDTLEVQTKAEFDAVLKLERVGLTEGQRDQILNINGAFAALLQSLHAVAVEVHEFSASFRQ